MIATLELVELRRAGGVVTGPVSAGATVLPIDITLDYDERGGSLSLNDVTYAYTAVAEESVTLATALAGPAEPDDPAWALDAQGRLEEEWIAWVDLHDGGDTVPAKIPTALIGYLPEGDAATGQSVEVEATDDGYRVLDRPDQAPVLDGSVIDPVTLPTGQTFSVDAPTVTEGFPEDHGWWQVVDGEVIGFWRLTGGVWVSQAIVTVEALQAGNILADAIDATDFTGVTMTAPTIRTSATGNRLEMGNFDQLRIFTGAADEVSPATVDGYLHANRPSLSLTSGVHSGGLGDPAILRILGPALYGALPIGSMMLFEANTIGFTYEDNFHLQDGQDGSIPFRFNADDKRIYFFTAGGYRLAAGNSGGFWIDGASNGDVGTGTFRDSVRAAIVGDYASAYATSWTPTWTAVTTNPVLGNGTLIGRYFQTGKKVDFYINLTMGSTTTYGTGGWRLDLPVTEAGRRWTFKATAFDTSAGQHYDTTAIRTASDTLRIFCDPITAGAAMRDASPTVPFTWADGDQLHISGTYEAL